MGPQRAAAATTRPVVRLRRHGFSQSGESTRRLAAVRIGTDYLTEESGTQARTQILLDVDQIQAVIPHRAPFLLIDRIVELEPRKRCVGEKDVSLQTDVFLRGHFPDYPVMPGVLI